jgi:hypothetical protein
MKTPVNETALIADFRKVINTLNSSTRVEHIVTSDRMMELAVTKWSGEAKKNKSTQETLASFSMVYDHQKKAISNRLGILG